ncbi:hypothetical protein ABT158_17695 [Nonomuraea sp. NPDC001636]|uniref:TlpA family protein disulfide reductase n=1 Tax=Nonomuraea sp. NPDC001636 TaxID=3154391 RepID=UPI00331AE1F3
MPFVIAVAVLVGVLCLVDLAMTLAVTRRLKEHVKLIDALDEVVEMGGLFGKGGLAVGDRVGDFDVRTVDGTMVALDRLPDDTVVAFIAAECATCRKKLPELVSWASGQDRSRVLVVIDGRGGGHEQMVGSLSPVAQVVLEDGGGAVSAAFDVNSFPSFFLVGEGAVTGRVRDVARLPSGSAA